MPLLVSHIAKRHRVYHTWDYHPQLALANFLIYVNRMCNWPESSAKKNLTKAYAQKTNTIPLPASFQHRSLKGAVIQRVGFSVPVNLMHL